MQGGSTVCPAPARAAPPLNATHLEDSEHCLAALDAGQHAVCLRWVRLARLAVHLQQLFRVLQYRQYMQGWGQYTRGSGARSLSMATT